MAGKEKGPKMGEGNAKNPIVVGGVALGPGDKRIDPLKAQREAQATGNPDRWFMNQSAEFRETLNALVTEIYALRGNEQTRATIQRAIIEAAMKGGRG